MYEKVADEIHDLIDRIQDLIAEADLPAAADDDADELRDAAKSLAAAVEGLLETVQPERMIDN